MRIFGLEETSKDAEFGQKQIECHNGVQINEGVRLFLDIEECGDGRELSIVFRTLDDKIEDVYIRCDEVFYWPISLAQNVAVTAEGLFGRMGHVTDAVEQFMLLAIMTDTTLVIELEHDRQYVLACLANDKFSYSGKVPVTDLRHFVTIAENQTV